jgi:deazaflavin-dependent oxidoreductase (nitroreductase family)
VPGNPLKALARRPFSYRILLRQSGFVERTDGILRRLTRGRLGVLDLVGLPSLLVTVPGRRTGLPRTKTLQYVPYGDVLLLVGSNWGRATHPAWSANLMAAGRVSVKRRDEEFTAKVRPLAGDEREEAWRQVLDFWPNYGLAQELAGGREFRLFELTRA